MLLNWLRRKVGSILDPWEPFDPSFLVDAARKQFPDQPKLADALAKCTRGRRGSVAYVYFVNSFRANKQGSEWQFNENIILEDTEEGDIVLDMLQDGRVGGAEFLDKRREK